MSKILRKSRRKQLIRRAYVSLVPPYSIDQPLQFLNEKRLFLLVSTGRTGTKLLASMLNSLDGHYVPHEPLPREQRYHRKALEDPDYSLKYIRDYRLKEMYLRARRHQNLQRYGEVNGGLRRNIREIKFFLPECRIAHVVRDGRDLISSVLNRKTLTSKDRIYNRMTPHDTVIEHDRWNSLDRFQKIAALWNIENRYMRENCDLTVKFESLIRDYSCAWQHLFDPLDLPVDSGTWEHWTKSKINPRSTNEDAFQYSNWTEDQKRFFWDECGREMEMYGYDR